MASSTSRPAPPATTFDDATESFADWARLHARQIATGAIVVAAIAGGAALYKWNATGTASRADDAFAQAQAPLATRDLAAAERQLRQVATQYDGTNGGAQAQLLLAQVLFDQGKFQQGLDVLRQADDAPAALKPAVRLLTAAGQEGLGKHGEAARLYEQAAADSRGDTRELELRASAARAYQQAGDRAAAVRIWTDLANREGAPIADEARVRLGELTAREAAAR
jgi:predicted negative regulator of RcsB-dependent stress response